MKAKFLLAATLVVLALSIGTANAGSLFTSTSNSVNNATKAMPGHHHRHHHRRHHHMMKH